MSNTEKIAQLMGKEIRCIVHNSKNKLQDILLISKTNIMIDAKIQVYGKAILKKMRSYLFFFLWHSKLHAHLNEIFVI